MLEITQIITNLGIMFTGIIAAIIALIQIRNNRRDARAARAAQLSCQIYQAYEDPKVRAGRRAIESISHDDPIPQNGRAYADMYVNKTPQRGLQPYEQGNQANISSLSTKFPCLFTVEKREKTYFTD